MRDENLKNLILSLKGNAPQWAFDELAQLWLRQFPEEALNAQIKKAFIIVPPDHQPRLLPGPLRSGERLKQVLARAIGEDQAPRMHALRLARSFAKHLGLRALEGLLVDDSRTSVDQKMRDRKQRIRDRRYRISAPEEFLFIENQCFIFVDDLVTTGATARAAYEALGQPPDFRIWALFHRSSLLKPPQIDKVQQK